MITTYLWLYVIRETEGDIRNTTTVAQMIRIEMAAEIVGGVKDLYKWGGIKNGPITPYNFYNDH
jgi:hypothetical protein